MRAASLLASAILLLSAVRGASAQDNAMRTAPEKTAFRETTRYSDVVRFVEAAARAAPSLIRADTFGYTFEGRALPLAVVGRLRDKSAEGVRASGRTVIYLQGNIHAGEVEGKESLMMLLRELAAGDHTQWLDSLVLLVAPIYNADGNERITLTNRGVQHGPIGGMGQRPNAQNYDLNRDHMKLDSPVNARSVPCCRVIRYCSGVSCLAHSASVFFTAQLDGEWIEMDFPAESPREAEPPPGLIDSLAVRPIAVSRNRFDYLIELGSAADVRAVQPDFTRLRRVEARGVIVTARADDGVHDFISRFFAPRSGVDEDPVTGSAHCCLAPYWAERLGRDSLTGYQASRRGGTVGVRLRTPRVLLRGKAITVLSGQLADVAST